MSAPRTILWLATLSAFIAALLPASLQPATTFGRTLSDLSAADRNAMERAQREVLVKMKPDAVSVWKDDRTGHSGEARIRRRYERNGMACAEVEHILKFRQMSNYVMPLCRVSDGTWRLAY